MAAPLGQIDAVFPGNGFEYWIDTSSVGTTPVYPTGGAGGSSITPGDAIWNQLPGVIGKNFWVRITRISGGVHPLDLGGNAIVLSELGGDTTTLSFPSDSAWPAEIMAAMEDGFSLTMAAAAATQSHHIHFEIVTMYEPGS